MCSSDLIRPKTGCTPSRPCWPVCSGVSEPRVSTVPDAGVSPLQSRPLASRSAGREAADPTRGNKADDAVATPAPALDKAAISWQNGIGSFVLSLVVPSPAPLSSRMPARSSGPSNGAPEPLTTAQQELYDWLTHYIQQHRQIGRAHV